MALHILRHTITAAPVGTVYGQWDVPLAESATNDLELAESQLQVVPKLIISSPLQRCLQLATYLSSSRNIPMITDARLMELSFGNWEGKRWDELAGPALDRWMQHYVEVSPPGGESYQELANRVKNALEEYKSLYENEDLLWVTHLGVARAVKSIHGAFSLEESFGWKLPFGTSFSL